MRLPDPLPFAGDTSPCRRHGCRACCFETRMPLLPEDLVRLASVSGRDVDDFSLADEEAGGRRLKNQDGQCVFLGPEGCTVYDDRPAGCRVYPLVFDPDRGMGTLDIDCPWRDGFRIRPKDRAALNEIVQALTHERPR